MLNFTSQTKETFEKVSTAIFTNLKNGEEAILSLNAEDSIFVRFNNNKVRQNTSVQQMSLNLQLQFNNRTTQVGFSLTGHFESDVTQALSRLETARQECSQLPEDPNQVAVKNNGQSDVNFKGQLLEATAVVSAVTSAASGSDLAGLYCSGTVISANKNSQGQNHWFANESFFMDYSIYNGEKAVKNSYAGTHWNQTDFERSLSDSKNQLALMSRPKKNVPRGEYRTYLAPAALGEILSMFSWGALGYGDYKKGNSSFKKLADGEKSFSSMFTLKENYKLGLTPRFNGLGELAPEELTLIENGKLVNFLVSSRSAKEYGAVSNNSSEHEHPRAIEVLPGKLSRDQILKELGTGLYLSNLHYINWSDRQNARITGMTRYACFWVENGEIVAPIEDLRFDESLFDCLGTNLIAVTDFQEVESETTTYERRAIGGIKIPGVLIKNFKFTL